MSIKFRAGLDGFAWWGNLEPRGNTLIA